MAEDTYLSDIVYPHHCWNILLIAGEWNRRGSPCLWPSSTPSPWTCRSNPNPNTNTNANTDTNTNTNRSFTASSHASPCKCRSPVCSSLVLRSGITLGATEKKSNHIIVEDKFVIFKTAILEREITVLSKMKLQKRKSKHCHR